MVTHVTKGLGWLKESFSEIEYTVISDYVGNPQKYQEPELRDKLVKMARR
jgi:hypothetical protein